MIPLLDLKIQFASIEKEVRVAIDGVLDSQRFILGPEVEAFEKEIAEFCGVSHGIGVSSGTDALLASLMALGIGPGDEVVTSAYSFFASAGVIARLGARPVFVDIDPETYNLNPEAIKSVITSKTKAVMPVHLFGQCADMDSILEIAGEKDIPIVEDAAQAIGAAYKGKKAGAMGSMGCLSFFPSKNLGAFGDGGMVVTDNPQTADKIRQLRAHGAKPKYLHPMIGGNFRLDALQAAVLRVKLKYLDDWSEKRRANAKAYDCAFAAAGLPPEVLRTPIDREGGHVFNQYVIRTPFRDGLKDYLIENGIGCEIYYPLGLHQQPCFLDLGEPPRLPHTEAAAQETLALPIYAELSKAQIEEVSGAVTGYLEKAAS